MITRQDGNYKALETWRPKDNDKNKIANSKKIAKDQTDTQTNQPMTQPRTRGKNCS